MILHVFSNLATQEAETGGSQIQYQSQELSEFLSNLARPCLKINTKGWRYGKAPKGSVTSTKNNKLIN